MANSWVNMVLLVKVNSGIQERHFHAQNFSVYFCLCLCLFACELKNWFKFINYLMFSFNYTRKKTKNSLIYQQYQYIVWAIIKIKIREEMRIKNDDETDYQRNDIFLAKRINKLEKLLFFVFFYFPNWYSQFCVLVYYLK